MEGGNKKKKSKKLLSGAVNCIELQRGVGATDICIGGGVREDCVNRRDHPAQPTACICLNIAKQRQ